MAVLYFLDSGGGSFDEELFANVTTWLATTAAALAAQFGRALPSVTFVHIPSPEFATAAGSPKCVGMADDGITPTVGANALFATLAATGAARAVFVGHDHGNAWCCPLSGVQLCYGRHTGYGGYGTWSRGARIIELAANTSAPAGLGVHTYVRMEDGSVNSDEWL